MLTKSDPSRNEPRDAYPSWFGRGHNRTTFLEYYDIPRELPRRRLVPRYVLVQGRRDNLGSVPRRREKRTHCVLGPRLRRDAPFYLNLALYLWAGLRKSARFSSRLSANSLTMVSTRGSALMLKYS